MSPLEVGLIGFAALTVLIYMGMHISTSLLLVSGPQKLLDSIAYPEVVPGVFQMDGVVSRKKQLLPYLTGQLRQIGNGL